MQNSIGSWTRSGSMGIGQKLLLLLLSRNVGAVICNFFLVFFSLGSEATSSKTSAEEPTVERHQSRGEMCDVTF